MQRELQNLNMQLDFIFPKWDQLQKPAWVDDLKKKKIVIQFSQNEEADNYGISQ